MTSSIFTPAGYAQETGEQIILPRDAFDALGAASYTGTLKQVQQETDAWLSGLLFYAARGVCRTHIENSGIASQAVVDACIFELAHTLGAVYPNITQWRTAVHRRCEAAVEHDLLIEYMRCLGNELTPAGFQR